MGDGSLHAALDVFFHTRVSPGGKNPGGTALSTVHDLSAVWMQDLPAEVGGISGRKKDIRRRDFVRLSSATHGHVRAELLDLVAWENGGDQRSPDGAGCHRIHADPFFHQRMGEG